MENFLFKADHEALMVATDHEGEIFGYEHLVDEGQLTDEDC